MTGEKDMMLAVILFKNDFNLSIITGTGIMQITIVMIAKIFNSFLWAAQPLMLAEISPTTVRNIFYGTVQFVGNFGAIAAPYLPLLVSSDDQFLLHESFI